MIRPNRKLRKGQATLEMLCAALAMIAFAAAVMWLLSGIFNWTR
jgi:hypothetical protein